MVEKSTLATSFLCSVHLGKEIIIGLLLCHSHIKGQLQSKMKNYHRFNILKRTEGKIHIPKPSGTARN